MTKEEQWKREAEIKLDELDDRGFDFDNWSISDAYERGYCDSAEPREKRIEELEKKLKNKCVDTNCPILSINKQNMKRIADLEKENADLKQFIKTQDRKLRQLLKVCDDAINRVEVLAKENAELKEKLEI